MLEKLSSSGLNVRLNALLRMCMRDMFGGGFLSSILRGGGTSPRACSGGGGGAPCPAALHAAGWMTGCEIIASAARAQERTSEARPAVCMQKEITCRA